MPIGVSNDIKTEVAKNAYRFVYLYEVDSNTHGTEYYTSSNASVTINENTYEPIEIQYTNISRDLASKVEKIELKITYVGLDFSSAQTGDYDGCEIRIYLHFPDVAGSKELYFKGYIEGFTISDKYIKVELVPITDYMSYSVPKRRYETKCPWVFKDSSCLLPDNYVLMEDGSVEMICDVEKYNRVISQNSIGYIANVIPKKYSGKIVKIKSYYLPYELKVTPDHPILAVKNKDLYCERYPTKKRRKIHIFEDNFPKCKYCSSPPPDAFFIEAENIESNDFVAVSFNNEINEIEYFDIEQILREMRQPYIVEGNKPQAYRKFKEEKIYTPKTIPISKDLLTFIGYFLAEGSASSLTVSFVFHKKETKYIEEILRIGKEVFGLTGKVRNNRELKRTCVEFYSKVLSCFLLYTCGKLALRKKLCKELMLLSPEKQIYILYGLFKGGGFLKTTTGKMGYYGIGLNTASRDLAWQTWTILLRNNIIPVFKHHYKEENNCVHTIVVNGESGNDMANLILNERTTYRDKQFREVFIKDDTLFFKVKRVEHVKYNGIVYDLQIMESNNTFIANGIVVHNCGYVGSGGPCDKTLDTCLNPSRFGGFPWIKVK